MQTVFVDMDATLARRKKQARLRRFLGPFLLLVGFGALTRIWLERHTLLIYPAVWPLGLAILGAGLLSSARHIARTNKEPKIYLTLLGQLVMCAGMAGPLFDKWTRSHDPIWLWGLFLPLGLFTAALGIAGLWFAVKNAPLWYGLLFSRQR